jgi:peptide/nickel transport system ATP-binding protein
VTPLLSIRDLRVEFPTEDGRFAAVDRVSLDVAEGEFVGVVGESGSGKSVTALAVMGLIAPPGRVAAGSIRLGDRDLIGLSERAMGRIRGREIAMIFQEPMSALNPVFPVGEQIAEGVRIHEGASVAQARARALEMLRFVGLPDPERRLDSYPHQLSGGMRQRVMIAIALACAPKLLIADEPTTALDVTIQAQILDLLRSLREKLGLAVLLITHDLGVVAELVDRVAVMYTGRVVETAPTSALFAAPRHPYTLGLLDSIPKLDEEQDRLPAIEGVVPNPGAMPPGCRFEPRCAARLPRCRSVDPDLSPCGPFHSAACVLVGGAAA